MNLGYLHPVQQFCNAFTELTVNVTDTINGDVDLISLNDYSTNFFMKMSTDYSDVDLLETLPLCIAYMLAHPEDETDVPFAFQTYTYEFSTRSVRANFTQMDIERVCGDQARQLPHMLNAILQMRMIGDDDGIIAIAVGTLKGALSDIRYQDSRLQD